MTRRLTPLAAALAPALTLALVSACAGADGDAGLATRALAVVDGTPAAVGIVDLLNAPTTTLALLDDTVGLRKNAATNLVAHRDGADGVMGTADDDLFDTLAEVDGVHGVGPKTLEQLQAWVVANGWLPAADELLGTWDGVAFTVAEAEATLALVNAATEAQLDVELALDRRAVDSILAARPLVSVALLADLYYVGPGALQLLKDAASPPPAGPAPGDCRADADCEAGLRCWGIPYDGSTDLGRCVDPSPIAGEGASCDRWTPCAEGLECAGFMMWGDGLCNPLWMFRTFHVDGPVAIPDGDPVGTVSDVAVYGLATVPVDIVVTLDVDHPSPADLVIVLHDPTGEQAVLWHHTETPDGRVVARGIPGDGTVNGLWWLELIDPVAGSAGTLQGWSLLLSSRWD